MNFLDKYSFPVSVSGAPFRAFCEVYTNNNNISSSIPAGDTYVKSTTPMISGESLNCTSDPENNRILITQAGKYKIDASFSSSLDKSNITLDTALFLNDNIAPNIHSKRVFAGVSTYMNGSFTGILNIIAGSYIDVRIKHDYSSAVGINVNYFNLNILYIGE